MAPNVTRAASLRPNTTPIDPDVKVPEAVRRAAAAADAAQAAAYPDQVVTPPPAPPGDTIVIAPPPAAVTPPGNTEPSPAPAPIATIPVPQPEPEPEETWEQRFRSAEGRRAKAEKLLSQTTDRLTSLENMLADMQAARAAPAPAPVPAPAAAPQRLITETEENEFGAEMLDVMGRRAREIVSPEIAELRATVTSLAERLQSTATSVTRTTRQSMIALLDSQMPTWREVNDMPEFKAWLSLHDPYFGVKRHPELLKAFEQNDTPRVLNFFKGFVSELAATTPADEPMVVPPAPGPARPALETLAAPGRARTPAHQAAPAEKQIITTTDVNAFYEAVRKGVYVGREAEKTALEQELFQAQREGRVRAV